MFGQKTCPSTKVQYISKKAVKSRIAAHAKHPDAPPLYYYKCPQCRFYHMTRQAQ